MTKHAYTVIAKHFRARPHGRTTALMGPCVEAFVTVTLPGQSVCEHYFDAMTRFGDATCTHCEAEAWSAAWVADGVMGDKTHTWIADMDHIKRSLLRDPMHMTLVSNTRS